MDFFVFFLSNYTNHGYSKMSANSVIFTIKFIVRTFFYKRKLSVFISETNSTFEQFILDKIRYNPYIKKINEKRLGVPAG